MQIFDISQEVFSCQVYPGDPAPEREEVLKISDGAMCNLTAFRMCAHNGTHVDAPYHFIADGRTIDRMPLESWIGEAYVASHEGDVTAEDAARVLAAARACGEAAAQRILIKGKTTLTVAAARLLAEAGIRLFGNESQTVGPEDAPMAVHLILLGAGVTLLEGIRLGAVPEGAYLLHAAPLNLGGADGAPCRATLIRF